MHMYVTGMPVFEFEFTYVPLINLAWHVDVTWGRMPRTHDLKFRWLSHNFHNPKRWSAITQQHDAASNLCLHLQPMTQQLLTNTQHHQPSILLRRFYQSRRGRRLCPIVFVTEFWIIQPLGSPSTTTLQHHMINQQHQSFYSRRLNALRYGRRLCTKFCVRTLVRWVAVWCFLWDVIWLATAEALQKFL